MPPKGGMGTILGCSYHLVSLLLHFTLCLDVYCMIHAWFSSVAPSLIRPCSYDITQTSGATVRHVMAVFRRRCVSMCAIWAW